jgi:hypothetical protein
MANLDESNAVDTFLEAVGCITKVLCSLLLRTCSKDTGATQSGRTTFSGETGPTPASQGRGDTIKQSFLRSAGPAYIQPYYNKCDDHCNLWADSLSITHDTIQFMSPCGLANIVVQALYHVINLAFNAPPTYTIPWNLVDSSE